MEASACKHDQSLTPFSAFLPFQENEGQGWKSQVSNHGLVFPVQEPIYSGEQKLLLVYLTLRNLQGQGEVKGQILEPEMLLGLLSLRDLQGFQEPCVRS